MLRFIGIALGLVLFVAAPFFLFGDRFEQLFAGKGALSLLRDHGAFAWTVAIGLLIADLAFPIPTTAVMAALGMIYGPVLGGAVAAAGSGISGLVGYGLCRYLGRPFALWLSGRQGLDAGERIFKGAGGWVVAMSRWVPVLSEVVACIAGLSRMSFPVFFVALMCGSIPLGFVFAAIGHLGGGHPVMTLVLSAVLPFLLWVIFRPIFRL